LVAAEAQVPSPSDAALAARLESRGFSVAWLDDDDVAALDNSALGAVRVVVISESSVSSKVGAAFRDVPMPVLSAEPAHWPAMKMSPAFTSWNDVVGDSAGQTILDLVPGQTLLPDASGAIAVTSAPAKFVWAQPSSAQTSVFATIAGQPEKKAAFGYRTGAAMEGGFMAPGPRVAFFTGSETPAVLSALGWQLFDAALDWALSQTALLVVGSAELSASDALLRDRLASRGYEIQIKEAAAATPNDGAGMSLVVVSESAFSSDIGTDYTLLEVPLVTLEPGLQDDLGLTAGGFQDNWGDSLQEVALGIDDPTHPLAAGLRGAVAVADVGVKFGWGRPAATAQIAASLTTDDGRAVLYGYEAGAPMVSGVAPARRVAFLAGRDTPGALTSAGWALFDSAITWAVQQRASLGACTGLPDGASCSDGNLCNGEELCQAGLCVAGAVLDCGGSACAVDSCLPDLGCALEVKPAGTSCSDGNACNGDETCSLVGTCEAGEPLVCNDGDSCTGDICEPDAGCVHQPLAEGASCEGACGTGQCTGAGACVVSVDDEGAICDVTPVVQCVYEASNQLHAVFGYEYAGQDNLKAEVDSLGNKVRGATESVLPPTWFVAGGQKVAFVAPFDEGSEVSWMLGDEQVVASAGTPRCELATGPRDGLTIDVAGEPVLVKPRVADLNTSQTVPATLSASIPPLPGDVMVSASGSASYSIPLWVPPGRNGMQPSVSLSYNSGGGNGLVGVGWSISGFSEIKRCAQTERSNGPEGGIAGIEFTNKDQFCLDGSPLVQIADGTYRTLIESFTKIEAKGDNLDGVGPRRFVVYQKDGRILTYNRGPKRTRTIVDPNDSTKRVEQEVALAWPVHEIRDRFNNAMVFYYEESSADGVARDSSTYEHRPKKIHYTGPIFNRSVRLVYEDRPAHDYIEGYVSGIRTVTTKRLAAVELHAPNPVDESLVKTYRLSYHESAPADQYLATMANADPDERPHSVTGRSLLATIKECDGRGPSALCVLQPSSPTKRVDSSSRNRLCRTWAIRLFRLCTAISMKTGFLMRST